MAIETKGPAITPDRHALERARSLHQVYLDGEIPGPARHEVHPGLPLGSRENVLYFTLPAAINFQRNSPALWASALATWTDPETQWLFLPERVCSADPEDVRASMLNHGLAIQTTRHPAAWIALCTTFHEYFADDPRVFLAGTEYDIPRIIHALQHEKRHLFPNLRGLKLSNYWLFVLSQFTDLPFQRLNELSIIPDTHVIRSTVELGLLPATASAGDVERLWRVVLRELDILPAEMHTALWRWSRNGFVPALAPATAATG